MFHAEAFSFRPRRLRPWPDARPPKPTGRQKVFPRSFRLISPFQRSLASACASSAAAFDKLPEGCHPEVLFQTHSHGDHYNPKAAVKSGVKRMYVQETWADAAREEVGKAAAKLGLPAPEVIGLPFGKPVVECGMRFTGVPANHSTSRVTNGVLERTSVYLVEKGASRLLYATDTGGLMGDAARMIGIDPHITARRSALRAAAGSFVHEPQALTAFIMEATDGDSDEDFRLFVHSSVQTVSRIVNMLIKYGRLALPTGQHAYITHLGLKYRDWPSEKENREGASRYAPRRIRRS